MTDFIGDGSEKQVTQSDDVTVGSLFENDELNELASHLDMLTVDQAWQVVNVVAEMLRRAGCRRP